MDDDLKVPPTWYEDFFTRPVNSFWERMVPGEAADADLGFIRRHLGIPAPARILDMPCGAGRHALRLARAGYEVTGVDLSEDAIARASAAARHAGLPARFIREDMRRFAADRPFDALVCFGNSISYFGLEETRLFFATLAASIERGGRLLLDTHCCAESIFPLQEERLLEFEGGSYSARFHYDALTSRLSTAAELQLDGERHSLLYAHHIVTSGTLANMLGDAGFGSIALFSDTEDAAFRPGSPRLLLVASRE